MKVVSEVEARPKNFQSRWVVLVVEARPKGLTK